MRRVRLRRSKRLGWLLVPVLAMGLGHDNTGEFQAAAREATDNTPPPFHARDFLINPEHFHPPTTALKPPRQRSKPVRRRRKPKPPAAQTTSKRYQILRAARSLLGIPYVYGGDNHEGIDCSGFTKLAYAAVGIDLPRVSSEQITKGVRVSRPMPGDLVYWSSPFHHVMIYYGAGLVIGAHHTGTVSSISPLWGSPTFYRLIDGS